MSTTILDGHVHTMEEIEVFSEVVSPTGRRRHSKEFKAQAIRSAMQPNVSIAAVALHYRLNANMLRRWVADQEELDESAEMRKSMSTPTAEFVPLQLGALGSPAGGQDIHIEVRRGAATITIRWPLCTAGDCATWLQGWLR